MAFTTRTLLDAGLLHGDLLTAGTGEFAAYAGNPKIEGDELVWEEITETRNPEMLRPASDPFLPDGGMRLVGGNLGRAIFKTSAVSPERWTIEAPCRIFSDQNEALAAFQAGELNRDVVVVVRFQGPRAKGMPELHKLTPMLGVLQDKGHKVALVTDGRMSGASGKVPAAIHLSPEALGGGPIGKLRDGDMIRVCAATGEISVLVDAAEWDSRESAKAPPAPYDTGRELFALFRHNSDTAEKGASAKLVAMEAEL
jgi:phosphogluconate dehydratase